MGGVSLGTTYHTKGVPSNSNEWSGCLFGWWNRVVSSNFLHFLWIKSRYSPYNYDSYYKFKLDRD